ncbi:uncharacterized protein MONOS_10533 [Monocercomonoides exilis]|uniref:uncharacterized protein n=1 Tax=Monocercomonoides exilis TaxID=2049356 RepID=UPI0035595BF7|nr:hypothetical protein MONOS_10533 [Monocercomonoides exilis]|eukprot:MONOS_10533.1-p1 / transcript=MONOS_10533.1 / gene=MONOS_10533 / organism=Monocercomonoides_exilis_PA203 / gene_product=unspecified product / transcript_product=unspecified product / location=Mono_scaffold00482:38725-39205(-) / protein_length=105 / sequence_SO=supercontig / SO=protein_coding / is_pseudo=false
MDHQKIRFLNIKINRPSPFSFPGSTSFRDRSSVSPSSGQSSSPPRTSYWAEETPQAPPAEELPKPSSMMFLKLRSRQHFLKSADKQLDALQKLSSMLRIGNGIA